jgi:hypothetical protein
MPIYVQISTTRKNETLRTNLHDEFPIIFYRWNVVEKRKNKPFWSYPSIHASSNHDFESTRNNGPSYCLLVWQRVMVAYLPEVNISSRENFQ